MVKLHGIKESLGQPTMNRILFSMGALGKWMPPFHGKIGHYAAWQIGILNKLGCKNHQPFHGKIGHYAAWQIGILNKSGL